MDNEQLTKVLAGVMAPFGYEIINAEFVPFRDVKVTWTRSYKQIELKVTDYLKESPEHIIKGILESVIDRMLGDSNTMDYPQDVIEYFTSPEFSKRHIGTYLKRAHIPQDRIVKTVDGYTFVRSFQDMPTDTISTLMRVIGIKAEYINDSDIEQIGIMAINNKIAQFGHFKGVKA